MSSYLDYQQSIIEEGVLGAAKRIGLNPTIFDSEVMSQHYAGHQWIVFENSVEDRRMCCEVGRMSQKLLKRLESNLPIPVAESLMRCSCLTESDQDSSHDQSTSS